MIPFVYIFYLWPSKIYYPVGFYVDPLGLCAFLARFYAQVSKVMKLTVVCSLFTKKGITNICNLTLQLKEALPEP